MTQDEYTSVVRAPATRDYPTPVQLADFIASPVRRRRWAVEGIWPEATSGIIAGKPKSGKSTLALELAVSLATGTPFMNLPQFAVWTPTARVTYLQAENSDERLRRDLDAVLIARGLGFLEPVECLYDLEGPPVGHIFRPLWDTALEGHGGEPDLEILSRPDISLRDDRDLDWLCGYAEGRDYLFIDPLYLFGLADPNDTGGVSEMLNRLDRIRSGSGCAVILTHQQSDKRSGGATASTILGSTLFHAWYEGALFCKRTKGGTFTLESDQLREMSEERDYVVEGLGVGKWFMVPAAQGAEDSVGRPAPRVAAKQMRLARLAELLGEHPDWTNGRLGEELGVAGETVKAYTRELRGGGDS